MAPLASAALVGCKIVTTVVDASLAPTGDRATVVEKLPLTVGVFYSAPFRDYAYDLETPAEQLTVRNIGRTSVALFDRTLRALFTQVVTLDSPHAAPPGAPALAAIIEPEITEYDPILMTGSCTTVDYLLILRSQASEELGRWPVSGKGCEALSDIISLTFSFEAVTLKSTQNAMRAVEAKILTQFLVQPEVRRWLAGLGIARTGRRRNGP